MTPETVGPLSRPVGVAHLPPEGLEVVVEADREERDALARDFKLEAVHALEGRFALTGSPARVRVRGRVTARIVQICVVTLDPFESTLEEEVEVDFVPPDEPPAAAGPDEDPPDTIVNGRIDLGSLTAEFLALGLDPYPKKPDAAFAFEGDEEAASPFAALGRLKRDE